MGQDLPGCAIAFSAPFLPLRAIEGNLGGGAMQQAGQPFLAPGLPLRLAPNLALGGLRDQPFAFGAISPGTQLEPAHRRGQGPRRSGEMTIDLQQNRFHEYEGRGWPSSSGSGTTVAAESPKANDGAASRMAETSMKSRLQLIIEAASALPVSVLFCR